MLYKTYLDDYKQNPQYDLNIPERLGDDGIKAPERKSFIAQFQRASGNLFQKKKVGPFIGEGPRTVPDSNSTINTHISANTDKQLNGLITAETRDGEIRFTSTTTEPEFYVSYVLLK